MTTQYAIQITGADRLELNTELPVPKVGPNQVLLQIEACGLCYSDAKLLGAFDMHPRKGDIVSGIDPERLAAIPTYHPGAAPVVPGHEPVARVAAVGEDVKWAELGTRVLVQTEFKHLPTAGSKAALGYNFDGGLADFVLVDEAMAVDPATGASCLVPVGEQPSRAAVALVEPWACVEMAYALPQRTGLARGGSLLVVVDDGYRAIGLDEFIAEGAPGRRTNWSGDGPAPDGLFDDIIYVGANPARVEALARHLASGGILNIVTCGRRFPTDVAIDLGRVHYDFVRVVGTAGDRPGDGYAWIPPTGEVRVGDRVAVIGAGGPMGLMHAVRTATLGAPGVSLDAVDIDDRRLNRVRDVLLPIAGKAGVPARTVNSMTTNLAPAAYTYVALMVPDTKLTRQLVDLAGRGAIINAFAGFPAGSEVGLDLNALIERQIFLTGTSGSRIQDMETVLARIQASVIDTTVSLDAICGLAGVPEAMAAVKNRTARGKIVVYPQLRQLGLVRLADMPMHLPDVAVVMAGSGWTRAVEEVLLALRPGELTPLASERDTPPVHEPERGLPDTEPAPPRTNEPVPPSRALPSSVSPRARRLGDQYGLDPLSLKGSGPNGRVLASDVEAAIRAAAEEPAPPARAVPRIEPEVEVEEGQMEVTLELPAVADEPGPAEDVLAEDVLAAAGGRGKRGVESPPDPGEQAGPAAKSAQPPGAPSPSRPQMTLNTTAPANALIGLRNRMRTSGEALGLGEVTITDLVSFAAVRVLAEFPSLNSRPGVGLAVATKSGLVIGTIAKAGELSLNQFSARARALVVDARAGLATDTTPGFLISNLGALGVESFTLTLPAKLATVLGVNAITPRVTVGDDGSPRVEQRLGLSLTLDRGPADAAYAARFLKALAAYIADIDIRLVAGGAIQTDNK